MILCSQAKLENDNRAINIKRGIRNRYLLGWRPGPAPKGYLNLKVGNEATIILDKDKALYIKQMFEKVGLEKMKVSDLRTWMKANTPLLLAKSSVYEILRNHFYYGKLSYKEELLDGKHPHIIEKELFDRVQANLKPLKEIDWNHRSQISVAKFITCGGCGDTLIERHKNRRLKSGKYRKHIYYCCSKFKQSGCNQPSLTYLELMRQLASLVSEFDILRITFPSHLQKDILEYSLISTISTQNPNSTIVLFRSRNQNISEVDEAVLRMYLCYVILCKEVHRKVELLEILKAEFLLKDKALSLRIVDQS